MDITIWGATGSIPYGYKTRKTLGNSTTCIEIAIGEEVIILDAGSGIVHVGEILARRSGCSITLCLSHFHADHIMGIPFFKPLYQKNHDIRIISAGAAGSSTEQVLKDFFKHPFCPVTLDMLSANITFETVGKRDDISLGDGIRLLVRPVNHPGGCSAFRIDAGGKTFCFSGDFEYEDGPMADGLKDLLRDADLAVMDTTYTPDDYENYVGFGHSHWRDVGNLCNEAGVKRWLMSHHNFLRTEDELREIEKEARAEFPNARLAVEREKFTL